MIVLFFLASLAWADPTLRWTNAVDVVEKHEFYQNHEIISKPKDTWETLFAVLYRDASLRTLKDCVYYRVPGEEAGVLKIKTLNHTERCSTHLFAKGDQEWNDIKGLQFALYPERISMQVTLTGFKYLKWHVPLFNVYHRPVPKMLMSSAEYRSQKVFFLMPKKESSGPWKPERVKLKNDEPCHQVDESCNETGPAVCDQCPEGWYEIPNGCDRGPKFCGRLECGKKNGPACRRGMKWQREDKSFECRSDDSFAFCGKGLKVHCQGSLPYCI